MIKKGITLMKYKQDDCNEENLNQETNNKRMTITEFLEKYKIWFTTLLSFALTCSALMVSIASYNINKYQTHINEQTMINTDLERQPYFSIENVYSDDEQEYTYIVRNTGGEIRYVNIYICPYLFVEKINEEYKTLDCAFIELLGLYRNSNIRLNDDVIFAFKDYMFNDINNGKDILANDLFQYYSSLDNLEGMNTSIRSELFYNLQISYVNYKNEYKVDVVTLSRSSDISGKTNGNNLLNIDMSGRYSLNIDDIEIVKQCKEIIENLRKDFGQIDAVEKYRKERF